MWFRLLGPVEVLVGGRPVPLGGTKPRALLAALVLEQGHVVPASRLVEVLWGDDPPPSARSLIQTYVSTTRRSFAQHGLREVIVTKPPGYAVRLDEAVVDAEEFSRLITQAKQSSGAHEYHEAAGLLRRALAMWQGPALFGLEDTLLRGEARRLDELHVGALEERYAVELLLGRVDHLAELTGAVARHPANERLRGQLMITLYRLGRQADALACFREGRDTLVEELGV